MKACEHGPPRHRPGQLGLLDVVPKLGIDLLADLDGGLGQAHLHPPAHRANGPELTDLGDQARQPRSPGDLLQGPRGNLKDIVGGVGQHVLEGEPVGGGVDGARGGQKVDRRQGGGGGGEGVDQGQIQLLGEALLTHVVLVKETGGSYQTPLEEELVEKGGVSHQSTDKRLLELLG